VNALLSCHALLLRAIAIHAGLRSWLTGRGARLAAAVGFGMAAMGTPIAADAQTSLLVLDANTGKVLHAVNADQPRYPASLTKMMTLYLAFDALDRKRFKLNSQLSTSRNAAAMPPTELGLTPGRRITLRDAILAITTESANDAAVLVGESLAGSESRFASLMTAKAHALGMHRTRFANASGLPDPGHRTTARDMATLARALLRHHPHHYHYFGQREFRFSGRTYHNHNRLLGIYPGMDGIKTGFTRASGYNLVASAKRGGRRLIGVVMGSSSAASRNQTMARILDEGFRNAPAMPVKQPASKAVRRTSVPRQTDATPPDRKRG
jgi:D-alanyl-D-alanine carboxypeptidase